MERSIADIHDYRHIINEQKNAFITGSAYTNSHWWHQLVFAEFWRAPGGSPSPTENSALFRDGTAATAAPQCEASNSRPVVPNFRCNQRQSRANDTIPLSPRRHYNDRHRDLQLRRRRQDRQTIFTVTINRTP